MFLIHIDTPLAMLQNLHLGLIREMGVEGGEGGVLSSLRDSAVSPQRKMTSQT